MILPIMEIIINNQPSEYDQGIHPSVTLIKYRRSHQTFEEFLRGGDPPPGGSPNRFPNLINLELNGETMIEGLGHLSHPSLESIICYCKMISFLDLDCPQLKTLVVHDTGLERIERLCCPLLKKLDLSRNNLTVIPSLDCPLLEKLFLSENNLRSFEGSFPTLKKLFLDSNAIDSLVLHHEHLEVLNISSNRMTNLELDCPALIELYAERNGITGIFNPSSRNLKKLDLGGNPISELVLDCPFLEELTTKSTLLEEINFSGCPNLTNLGIRAETIKNLNTLEYCSNLKKLVYFVRRQPFVDEKAMKRFIKQINLLLEELPDLEIKSAICYLEHF